MPRPRLVGFNVIAYNDAPFNGSGYYAASGALSVAFDVTLPVASARSALYDVTNAVAGSQSASYDMRQQALDGLSILWDDTTPIDDSQTIVFDITNQGSASRRCISYSIAMPRASAHAGIVKKTGAGTLTKIVGDAALTHSTSCEL